MSPRDRKARRRSPKAASRRHRASRARRVMRRAVLAVVPAVAVAALVAVVVLFGRPGGEQGPPRAAIVDQLELTVPNPEFVAGGTATLEEAGYAVDYYPGEEVTVEFYRSLPARGYDVIVLRTHSALLARADGPGYTDKAVLFTANPYNPQTDVTRFRLDDRPRLASVSYGVRVPPFYLGIKPEFVTDSMQGDFEGATVILMGCHVLRGASMAEAFIHRGAGEVVGWDRSVTAGHTDAATQRLLEHMMVDGLSTEQAVARTMQELGPDPAFDAELIFYSGEG